MEATREVERLLDKILPPRLEDAGLEDCALPPDSIKEAFLKAAATAVLGRRAASIFTSDEEEVRCVDDPWPEIGESSDVLVGIREGVDPPPGPCAAEKVAGVPEVMGDKVAAGVTDAEEKADKVVAVGPDLTEKGKDACVDGLRGLKIGKKGGEKGKNSKSDDEEEREGELPILAEACV